MGRPTAAGHRSENAVRHHRWASAAERTPSRLCAESRRCAPCRPTRRWARARRSTLPRVQASRVALYQTTPELSEVLEYNLLTPTAICHPTVVAAGRHTGATVHSCEPFDPESKDGVEATVKTAIVAMTGNGTVEITHHALSTPGNPH